MKASAKEPIRVTDHAVLRYMERAMGLQVETVREHILETCVHAAAFGAVAVKAEGLKFVIQDNVVVSVVPDRLPGKQDVARNIRIMREAKAS